MRIYSHDQALACEAVKTVSQAHLVIRSDGLSYRCMHGNRIVWRLVNLCFMDVLFAMSVIYDVRDFDSAKHLLQCCCVEAKAGCA